MLRTTVPDNPFEIRTVEGRPALYYQNQQANLGGIHVDTEPLTGDFDAMMQAVASRNNNFYRHWMIAYYVYYTNAGKQNSCPFLYSGGTWDLSKYNTGYFTRLRAMLTAARRAQIVVQLTLFDRSGLSNDTKNPDGTIKERRWSVNPWNKNNNVNGLIVDTLKGLPKFFERTNTALAKLQDDYVTKVVMETREFSNVVYEIMNEPSEADLALRVKWANAIVNVIAPLIQGRRLIFYNDHSVPTKNPATRGKDVNYWRDQIPAAQSSYASLDGVTFHEDPNVFDPAKVDNYGWTWGHEKLQQYSSDTYTDEDTDGQQFRDKYDWNKGTASYLFGKRAVFQAETIKLNAAQGIKDANPRPTRLRLVPFMGCWNKTSTGGPHFNLRFDSTNRYVAFEPINDRILTQGRLVSFTDATFNLIPDGQTAESQFTYTLSADGKMLSYSREGFTQTFVRIPFDLEPLLFGWEKIGENPPTSRPRYFIYFKQNAGVTNISLTVRDPANQQNVWDQGEILQVKYYPPQLVLRTNVGGTGTYNYELSNNGQNLTLVNTANNRRQDYKRII